MKKMITICILILAAALPLSYTFTGCKEDSAKEDIDLKKRELDLKEKELAMKEKEKNGNNETGGANETEQLKQVVSSWLACWQTRDIECYKSYITYDYVFMDSNKPVQGYDKRLATISKHFRERLWINITHSDYSVNVSGSNATVSYYQTYSSDQYSDYGFKTIYLRKENGKWKICKDTFDIYPNQ